MKQILLFAIFSILVCLPIRAQNESCIKIESENGAKVFSYAEPVQLKAIVGNELSTIGAKYIWKLSGGKIVSGENTDSILLDLKESGGETVKVTVNVEGISGLCSKSAYFTFEVAGYVCQLPLDYFRNNLTLPAVKARLDNLAYTLKTNPEYIGYVTSTRNKSETIEDAQKRLRKWKKYLIKTREVSDEQAVFVLLSGAEDAIGETIFQVAQRSAKILPTEGNYLIID